MAITELQKYNDLKAARQKGEREKAQKTLKKYSTGKNKGLSKNAIGNAKDLIKNLTPTNLFSLAFQINIISDWMYGLAFLAAILKDMLDIVQATGFLYALVIVATFCCSIFIGFMMLLGSFNSNSNSRIQRKVIRSWLVLLGGTGAELLFGIDLLPIETFTVLIVYGLALMERRQAQTSEKTNNYRNEYAEAA